LRFVGIVNAAIWFGAGVFFTLVVLPGVFSSDLHVLFGDDERFKFYAGGVALALFKRFFVLQYVCGIVALLHLVAEKLYLSKPYPRWGTAVVLVVLGFSLVGGAVVQPKLLDYRKTMYSTTSTSDQKARATHSFAVWHATSETANLFVMIGLLAHLVGAAKPEEPGRYSTLFPKFRG